VLDAVALLERALAIPSVSGSESEVAHYLVSQMKGFAEDAFVDEAGNAVARLGRGETHVMFLGHIDTVPGEIPVRVQNGKLYGRGAVDAKGPFCAAVAAASLLREEVLEHITLTLVGAVEEEVPSSKGARHALCAYPKPDLLIIGEPSGWDAMTLGYKGRLVVKVGLEKGNFHSAGEGTTAAEDLVAAWGRVRAWADGCGGEGLFERVQVSLQAFNTRSDGLSQSAEAVMGLRLPPSTPPEVAERALREVLGGLELHFTGHEAPYRGPKDTPLTRAFRHAIRTEGGRPRFKLKTGTSDMNVVAARWGVPVLAYGPGDSALDHTPDEHVDLEEYGRAIRVLRGALTHLATARRRSESA